MGDRVAVLADGVLQQCAAPRDLYRTPANAFVAGFVGSPPMNLFQTDVSDGAVRLGGWAIPVPRTVADAADRVVLGIRPEHCEIADSGIEIIVDVVEELGADAYLYGRIGGPAMGEPVVVRIAESRPPARGERLRLRVSADRLHFFGADGRRLI